MAGGGDLVLDDLKHLGPAERTDHHTPVSHCTPEHTAQLVWILAPRLPEPEGSPQEQSSRFGEADRGPSGRV